MSKREELLQVLEMLQKKGEERDWASKYPLYQACLQVNPFLVHAYYLGQIYVGLVSVSSEEIESCY